MLPSPRPRPRATSPRPRTTNLTRSSGAVAVTALALLVAGCGVEDAQQEAAREEVQAYVRALGAESGYDASDVHCTDAAGIWFSETKTDDFTCAVRLVEGGCDWFAVRVDRPRRRAVVTLAQRDAGCTLGF